MEPLATFVTQFLWFSRRLVGGCILRGLAVVAPALCRHAVLFLGCPTDVPRPCSGPACPESIARNLARARHPHRSR